MTQALATQTPLGDSKTEAGAVAAGSAETVAFTPAGDLQSSERFTRRITRSHYENFSVISILLPAHLRQDFCNVYAFCRLADDLGDEMPTPEAATLALQRLRDATAACYDGRTDTALFQALDATIRRHDIPAEPFLDLIDAFQQDQQVRRYPTHDAVLDYCRRSANPVGRLVLYMTGYRDAQRQALSDQTCTALQLANFLQDVRRDRVQLDRVYLPQDSMQRFGVTDAQLLDGPCDDNFRNLMRFEVDRTAAMFDAGDVLLPLLEGAVRRHVMLFGAGGRAILAAVRGANYDTLSSRPVLSTWQKVKLITAAAGTLLHRAPSVEGGS